MMTEVEFWAAAALLTYTFAGYPLLVALLARLRPRRVARRPVRPAVSVLIVAYNEAAAIRRRLENCLALEYPREKLEIVVASDGSTDGTADIAREFATRGVSVREFPHRRGKAAVLNDVIPECRGEIVALGDARQLYEATALTALVENFADPSVGAVSGELHLVGDAASATGQGLGFYWRYEKFIRRHESRLDSTVGATGAIYALRRDLFAPIPVDTLLDDVLIPLMLVRRGYRVVFEPEARAFDRVSPSGREEFARKVRTIGGNAQLLSCGAWLWHPGQNRLWFQLLSHKGLRLVSPALLVVAFVSSSFLIDVHPVYAVSFAAQILFYTSAAAGVALGRVPGLGRWFGIPYAFCLLNVTAVVGVVRYLTGRQQVTWRTAIERAGGRPADAAVENAAVTMLSRARAAVRDPRRP